MANEHQPETPRGDSPRAIVRVNEIPNGSDRPIVIWITTVEGAGGDVFAVSGVDVTGTRIPLTVGTGSTKDPSVAEAIVADLDARGLDTQGGAMFVVDMSEALRPALHETFGDEALVQRSRVRYQREVLSAMPKPERPWVRTKLRSAFDEPTTDRGVDDLYRLADVVERSSVRAAIAMRSEVHCCFTINDLDIHGALRRSLTSTAMLEDSLTAIMSSFDDPSTEVNGYDLDAVADKLRRRVGRSRRIAGYRQLPRLASSMRSLVPPRDGAEAPAPDPTPENQQLRLVLPWTGLAASTEVRAAHRWGIAGLVFALVITYLLASRLIADVFVVPVGMSLHPTDIVLGLLLLAWIVWLMTDRLPAPIGLASALGMAVVLVLLFAPFLNGANMSPFQADGAERGIVRGLLYAGLFIATYHLARDRGRAIRLLVAIVAVTVLQAAIAVQEILAGQPFVALGNLWQSLGLQSDPNATRTAADALQFRLTGELRAGATAPHPLVLVGILAAGIGICIAFYLHSSSRRVRLLLVNLIVLQLAGIGATNQRTAFVALTAVGLVVLFTQIDKLPTAMPLALAVAAGGVLVAIVSPRTPRLILNFVTGQQPDHNVAVRTSKYELFPELLGQRPLLGAGYQTGDPALVTFDNGYLTELVELGIVGFAIFVAFLLVVAGRSFGALASAPEADRPLLLSAVLALVAFLASMITFDAMSFVQFFPMVLMVLAIGLARADELRRSRPQPAAPPPTTTTDATQDRLPV